MSELMGKGYGVGAFTNPWLDPCRYRLYLGGRNTKKSTDMLGIEPVFKILTNPIRNIIMARRNDTDNRQSTRANLWGVITERMGLGDEFKLMTNPNQIVYRRTGQKIVFRGFNNATGITSTKFEKGELTDVYFEEASEIDDYDAFRKLDGSLRGNLPKGVQLQITFAMNPWNRQHWIYEKLYEGRMDEATYENLEKADYLDCYDPGFQLGFGKGLYIHQSTYRINEYRSAEYDEGMAYLRENAPELYKVEGLGMWGNSTRLVYPEFTAARNIVSVEDVMGMRFRAVAIGIDTGYSNEGGHQRADGRKKSATTAQLVGITMDGRTLVGIDEWYHSNDGETLRPMMFNDMVRAVVLWVKELRGRIWRGHPDMFVDGRLVPVYVDSADKAFLDSFVKEAERQCLYGVQATHSTKIGIQTRVDFARWLMGYGYLKVCSKCENLIREIRGSRRGQRGEVRENLNDHALNAWEYGWTPLKAILMSWGDFKPR